MGPNSRSASHSNRWNGRNGNARACHDDDSACYTSTVSSDYSASRFGSDHDHPNFRFTDSASVNARPNDSNRRYGHPNYYYDFLRHD